MEEELIYRRLSARSREPTLPKPDSVPGFDGRQQSLIRALLYPILFEKNPLDAIDHVWQIVVEREALSAAPVEYLTAIRNGLAGETSLGTLLPQSHTEASIREFLAAIAARLEKRGSP